MLLSVDRIEGTVAVLVDEDGVARSVALEQLPSAIAEGDMVRFDGEYYIADPAETQRRREYVLHLQEKLRRSKNN